MGWLDFLFSFRGRAGRARFWLYCTLALPLYIALLIALWAYALSVPGAYETGGVTPLPNDPLSIAGAVLFFLLLAAVIFAGAAVSVKRLHDRNRAWWWLIIFAVLPDILFGLADYLSEGDRANDAAVFAIQVAALAIAVWGSIELGFLRGTIGTNRFGPDPVAAEAPA